MSKSNKKKRNNLILLIIALVALILVLVLLKNKNESNNTDDGVTRENIDNEIISVDLDEVSQINFKNQYGNFTFVQESEDMWKYTDDASFPVDKSSMRTIKNQIRNITYNRIILENADESDLAEYGLDDPQVSVLITQDDGTKVKIDFGIKAPLDGGYYTIFNDEATVYLINHSIFNAFNKNETDMLEVESLPNITTENIRYLNIKKQDETILEMKYNQEETQEIGIGVSWDILEPYEQTRQGDLESISTYLNNFASLSYSGGVDHNADDLDKYGLEDPSYIIYLEYFETVEESSDDASEEVKIVNEDHTLEIHVGSNDDGEYYVKTPDSNAIHLMRESTINNIVDIDPFDYISKFVNLVNIGTVDSLEIVTESDEYIMEIERETITREEDGEKKEELEEKYYYNGEEVEEGDFKGIYHNIISQRGDHEVPEDLTLNNSARPVISITFNRNTGDDILVEYYTFDESYYLVSFNGDILFLVDIRPIDKMIDEFDLQIDE